MSKELELDLPVDLIDVAFKEIGETSELRKEKLIELRNRINSLPVEDRLHDTSDLYLIRFLRGRKFNVDLALKTTENLVRFNKAHPEWVDNHSAKEFLHFKTFFQLLKDTDNGRVICVFRPSIAVKLLTPKFIKENPFAIIRSMIWFMNEVSHNVYAQICGGILFESFEGFTLRDTLTIAQACPIAQQIAAMKYVQNCLGFRFNGAYIFHEPSFITWLWYLSKGIISRKIRDRFHLHGTDLSHAHRLVSDISILPIYYGGKVKDGDYDFIEECVQREDAMAAMNIQIVINSEV